MNKIDVSIIIINYNTKDYLINCISSVYEKTKDLNFDIWVIDNASTDGSCEKLKSVFPEVNLIKNNENKGFASANNLAIKQSKGEYVFFLNSDTVLINNAIKILFDSFNKNNNIAACGGNLYNPAGKNVHSYGYFASIKQKILKMTALRYLFKGKYNDRGNNEKNECKPVELIIGADLMIKRSVLNEIGLFNEDFFLYFEEMELQYRMAQKGYKAFIIPDAKIIHYENASFKDRKYRRQIFAQSEYFFFKSRYKNKLILFFIQLLCSLNLLYRLPLSFKHSIKIYKNIWK